MGILVVLTSNTTDNIKREYRGSNGSLAHKCEASYWAAILVTIALLIFTVDI